MRGDLGRRQAGQPDAGDGRLAGESGDHGAKWLLPDGLGIAIGRHQDQSGRARSCGQVHQQPDGGRIRPLQVVQHDQQAGRLGLGHQGLGGGFEQPEPLLRRPGHSVAPAEAAGQLCRRSTREPAEDLQERPVRRAALVLAGTPQSTAQPQLTGLVGGFLGEARLAHAGLARDQHHLPLAVERRAQAARQQLPLRQAADQRAASSRVHWSVLAHRPRIRGAPGPGPGVRGIGSRASGGGTGARSARTAGVPAGTDTAPTALFRH